MSMLLDVIVLAVLALCIFINTKRGFVKSLLHFVGFFVALICAYLIEPMLSPILEAPIAAALNSYDGSSGSLSDMLHMDITAEIIATVASFAILFVVFSVIVALATWLVDLIFRLPVLKQANKLLGFILGLTIGIFYAQLLSIFFFTFSEFLIASQDWVTREAFEGSVVARWMFDHNLFKMLFSLTV